MAFEKILLSKNLGAINNEIFQLEAPKNYFKNYVNRLTAIGITSTNTDLETLFENPKAYVTEKLTAGEEMKVGGLTLNKEKLFELIEKPVGTNEIIRDIVKDQQNATIRESYHWKANRFTIIEGAVTISATELEHINKRNSLFIETENQQLAINKLAELVVIINEINNLEFKNGGKISVDTDLSEYIRYNQNTKTHEPGPQVVKYFK